MAKKINTSWFKHKLASEQVSQRQLAKKLGLDPAAVSLTLRGGRKLQMNEAAAIADLFRVPMEEVIEQAGVEIPSTTAGTAPVVGWVDGLGAVHERRPEGPRVIPIPPGMGEGAVALRYKTAGTPADALDGWVAIYQHANSIGVDCVNRLCVVRLTDERYAVRIVRRGYSAGTFNLLHWNTVGDPMENVGLISAAPVLWFRT